MEANNSNPLKRLQTPLQNNFSTFASLQTPIYAFANCKRYFKLINTKHNDTKRN